MFEGPVQRLIDELARLPGIGQKTAQRLAFHLLGVEEADARRLASAINDMRDQVTLCERCFNVAAGELCAICRDTRREASVLCVVERPQDIVVVERSQEFRGLYHVLGGSLSPINGIGTVHHVAMAIGTAEEQIAIRDQLLADGVGVTDVRDRCYFTSIYFREPGGVLFEIATMKPGFTIDEDRATLGRDLKLPPWEEPHRDSIEKNLVPVSYS